MYDEDYPSEDFQPSPSAEAGGGRATASLILGIFGLIAWLIPLFGLPITITGLILGVKDIESRSRGLAIAGVVLCAIGLAFSALNAAVGAYLGATGQHPMLN